VEDRSFILRVSINNIHESRTEKVLDYWSKVTNIPPSQFTKTSLIKSKTNKIYSNESVHFGTLRIKVRNGANLRRRILGSINKISEY
jgi:hypothetical protein